MRALITGGCGFIGSHLAEALLERGDAVTVVDDLSTGRFANIEHLVGAPWLSVCHRDDHQRGRDGSAHQ